MAINLTLQEQRKDWTPTDLPKRVTVSVGGTVKATFQIAGVKWTPDGWAYCGPVGFSVAPVPIRFFGRTPGLIVKRKHDPEPTHYAFYW